MDEQGLIYIYLAILLAIVALFAFGLWRGRRVIATNDRIADGQREIIDLNRRNTEANERQAAALEAIATALKTSGTTDPDHG